MQEDEEESLLAKSSMLDMRAYMELRLVSCDF